MTLTYLLPRATKQVKRHKEDQLRFYLSELNVASKKFNRRNNRYPQNIDELILDSKGVKYLRNKYIDPFTKKANWNFEVTTNTILIFSKSDKISISGKLYSEFR